MVNASRPSDNSGTCASRRGAHSDILIWDDLTASHCYNCSGLWACTLTQEFLRDEVEEEEKQWFKWDLWLSPFKKQLALGRPYRWETLGWAKAMEFFLLNWVYFHSSHILCGISAFRQGNIWWSRCQPDHICCVTFCIQVSCSNNSTISPTEIFLLRST